MIAISYNEVTSYLNKPEHGDIESIIHEIQLYDPNFSAYNTRTWENHQLLVQKLYQAQYDFVNNDVCYVGQGKILFEKAQQALAFRDDLNRLTNSILSFLSPEGIYFPNEFEYKATLFAFEAYRENGGGLEFEDWYYDVFTNWSPHGYKHFPPKNVKWKDIVKTTKTGPAKYLPSINIEEFEREAWRNGTPVTNGKDWKVMKYEEVIGASEGKETVYIRIERTAGTIHGHPISEAEYKRLLK